MKEIKDITEAAQMLAEVYKELEINNADSKEYLDEFIKESDFKSIKDYENCVMGLSDKFDRHLHEYDERMEFLSDLIRELEEALKEVKQELEELG